MKPIITVLSACALAFSATSALAAVDAAKAQATAKASGCLSCHDVSKKKMGPSFKAAAADLKKAGATTADKAVAAIKGKHADMKAKDEDLKAISEWILSM